MLFIRLMHRIEAWRQRIPNPWRDMATTMFFVGGAGVLCFFLSGFDSSGNHPGLIFVLAVALVSRLTENYFWGIFASLCGVICVNYIFTYPYWEFNFTMTGYPLTFLSMMTVSSLISALTTQIKKAEQMRRETEKEAVRANLLRAMSHDIRTPLTGIVGNTAALLENEDSISRDQRRQLLQDVSEDAQWLIQMVENLLSITRISDTHAAIHKEVEALEEIIAVAAQKFERRFGEHTRVEVSVPEEVLMVSMDATLIQQVLMNLMENAVLHGKTTSLIKIELSRKGRFAVVSVSDDGQGIAENRLRALFESQLSEVSHSNFDRKKNMGIGLSVCRTIIKVHGGDISAENRPDGGACFRFTLLIEEESNEN